MTIKEINERWVSIQERRDEILDRHAEGESIVILDELNGRYNAEMCQFRNDLMEGGLNPTLAEIISRVNPGWI